MHIQVSSRVLGRLPRGFLSSRPRKLKVDKIWGVVHGPRARILEDDNGFTTNTFVNPIVGMECGYTASESLCHGKFICDRRRSLHRLTSRDNALQHQRLFLDAVLGKVKHKCISMLCFLVDITTEIQCRKKLRFCGSQDASKLIELFLAFLRIVRTVCYSPFFVFDKYFVCNTIFIFECA